MVPTRVHARGLIQIKFFFWIFKHKALTPNDYDTLAATEDRLKRFAQLHNAHPNPFKWKFDRQQLGDYMTRLNKRRVERGEEPLDMAEQPTDMAERPMEIAA